MKREAVCCDPHKRKYHVRFLYNPQKRVVEEKVEVEEIVYQHDVYKAEGVRWWRGAIVG